MRWLLWSLLLLLLLECTTARRMADASAYDEQEFDGDYDEDDELPFAPEFNKFAEKVQRAVDSQGLLRARRWGNIANGILLGATGPVTLGVSLFGLKLSGVVLSVYMTAAGALLTGLELGVSPIVSWTKQNLNWLTTHSGKTALLFFAGNLGWAFGKAGLVPALLTCANALFNLKFRSVLGFVSADEQPGFEAPMPDGLSDEGAAGFDDSAQWQQPPEEPMEPLEPELPVDPEPAE